MKKRNTLIVLGIGIIFCSCVEENLGQTVEEDRKIEQVMDEENKPIVDIKVNRKYDDEGNLIAFDSTYTSYYSSVKGDTTTMDSLYGAFENIYKEQFPALFDKHFSKLFMNDTLFYDDFFHNDFFSRRVTLNTDHIKRMMFEMDSIKNEFYQRRSEIRNLE